MLSRIILFSANSVFSLLKPEQMGTLFHNWLMCVSSRNWIATLSWSGSLCVSVTPRAMPAGDLSPGRAPHAGQVEG